MQAPQTESPSEFTTSAVLTAYKALPESLRPFYAHIHCGSAAIVAALGLTAEDNNVLETAVKAIGDLADDAEAFDRDAAAESGTLADMIRELAGTLGDDRNPLVVSLDVIWGAISSSSIVTGADPDDDEDPIEHYLYDNSDLTGLMGAYWDLQGVLEIMFGELGMNADFRGSLIELPTEAASVAELNKSLQRLSSSSRACFAWCHNRIVSVLRDLSNDDPKVLEKNLESSGIQPLFIPAVLRQFNESRTASDVLAAVSSRFSPFDRELDAVFELFWNLQRAVSQKADHPARVALALLVSALAAMLDCRPEDIDSRASSRLAESDDLAASDRGLALHLAGIVAGVELVESDDPVMQMCRSFDEACESAEANQDICLPLSCALTAVNHFLKDEAAAKEHFKKLHLADATTETFLPSLATLSEFLVHHTPEKDDGSLLKKHFAPVIEGDYDGPTAGEHYAKLLSETLSRMDEESRALFTASFLTLGYLMSGIFARTPEEIEEFFKQAFPGFIVDPIIAMCMSILPAASKLAVEATEKVNNPRLKAEASKSLY